jgi:cob(I)alamin adenosyltransferase
MTKIYTKTGDGGETSLLSGGRVSKASDRIEAYGTIDELNSVLGMLRSEQLPIEAERPLDEVQRCLFTIGAALADPEQKYPQNAAAWSTEPLEEWIDTMDRDLAPLKSFILPGGCRAAGVSHLARTVCRRAERRIQAIADDELPDGILAYINRLSDVLFVLARWMNARIGVQDTLWNP